VIYAFMPTRCHRRLLLPAFVLAALTLFLPGRLAADLVWNPATGWNLEGGALSGLSGPDGEAALKLMNKARAAEERGSNGSAIRAYERVAKKYTSSVYAPEALYRAGMLRLARRQYFKSFDDFQRLIGAYPNTRRFNEVIGEQYRIAGKLIDGAHNRIWGIIPSFTNRTKGIQYFETILVDAPYSDYAPLALMNVARAHQYLHEKEEAIDALDRMVNSYPQSVLAPSAYLKLGELHASVSEGPYYDQASTKEAISYYEDFMILFPSDGGVPTAARGLEQMKIMLAQSKIKIGDFYFYKRDNYTAARVFYNEAITAYPDSTVAVLAKKRLAEVDAKASGQPSGVKKKRFWLF
jgi:outer membrane protein assembly factor BamD